MIKRFRWNIRTYRGVAGIIRRKTVFAVAFALVYGSLAISTGFMFYQLRFIDISEAYLIIGLLFLMGLLINGWLVLRLMRGPLEVIEHVEDDLVKMAETGEFILYKKQDLLNISETPFLHAYYKLLEHIDAVETQRLEFLAKVAHDIRSPVASILGYAELLTEEDLRHDDDFIDLTYSIIRKQGNQVCRLVEEAVLAAKIDAGRSLHEFTKFSLDKFLRCLSDEAREKFARDIVFDNPAGQVLIEADAVSLREAVFNLLDNAVKFSKPDQVVHLQLTQLNEDEGIKIEIKDHGIGIEEKDKSLLFRRFSRITHQRNQDVSGSGLGLYIAQKIVQKHSGTIEVESKPEVGSTFTICLPQVKDSITAGTS